MDVLKDMYTLKGCEIRFKTFEGIYEGTVVSIYPEAKRVAIDDVILLPDRDVLGKLVFLFHEFEWYSCIRLPEKGKSSTRTCNIYLNNTKPEYNLANLSDDDESCTFESVNEENLAIDEYILKLPESLSDKLPLDCEVFDSINSDFLQAIKYISKLHVIGVSFEGRKIGRHGNLSWICISTPSCTFLFDIESLKGGAFDSGLREIFQDHKIEKVIHDCRESADCLHHQFGTTLVKVFDTQVADYMINMQKIKNSATFKRVNSLDACLSHHLNVPDEFLYSPREHDSFYNLRPVSHEFQDFAIKNTIYLILLKQVLFNLLMTPYNNAVNMYLQILRDSSEEELLLEPSVPDEVPFSMLMEGIQIVSFKNLHEMPKAVVPSGHSRQITSPYEKLVRSLKKLNCQNQEDKVIDAELMNGLEEFPDVESDHHTMDGCESQSSDSICGNYRLKNSAKGIDETSESYLDRNPEKNYRQFRWMTKNMSNVIGHFESEPLANKDLAKIEHTASSCSVSSEESEPTCQQGLSIKNVKDPEDEVDVWAKLRSTDLQFENDEEAKKELEVMKHILIPAGMSRIGCPRYN